MHFIYPLLVLPSFEASETVLLHRLNFSPSEV
jgi:hypothetical protein